MACHIVLLVLIVLYCIKNCTNCFTVNAIPIFPNLKLGRRIMSKLVLLCLCFVIDSFVLSHSPPFSSPSFPDLLSSATRCQKVFIEERDLLTGWAGCWVKSLPPPFFDPWQEKKAERRDRLHCEF